MLIKTIYGLCLPLLLFTACSTGRVISGSKLNLGSNYCAPAAAYPHHPFIPARNTDSLLKANPGMPLHEVLTANATGTLELIYRLNAIAADTTVNGTTNKAIIRSQIQHRIMLASLEIDGIAAELDCEGEKADQLARYLDNFNSKRNTRLTVASIIVGAITTIATVAIKNDGAQNAAAISGGLISAGLGALTINAARKKINLTYDRNVLRDIWLLSDTSAVYPPFTWYMLNQKHFSNSGQHSLAINIKKRWEKFDLGGPVNAATEKLLFGAGGIHKADDLHKRAAMVNELQSTIRSLNQDLQRLLQYLGNLE